MHSAEKLPRPVGMRRVGKLPMAETAANAEACSEGVVPAQAAAVPQEVEMAL